MGKGRAGCAGRGETGGTAAHFRCPVRDAPLLPPTQRLDVAPRRDGDQLAPGPGARACRV